MTTSDTEGEVEEEEEDASVDEDSVSVDEDSDENSVEEEIEDEEIHQPDNNNNNVEEVAEELPLPPALRRSSRASKSTQDSVYSYLNSVTRVAKPLLKKLSNSMIGKYSNRSCRAS